MIGECEHERYWLRYHGAGDFVSCERCGRTWTAVPRDRAGVTTERARHINADGQRVAPCVSKGQDHA